MTDTQKFTPGPWEALLEDGEIECMEIRAQGSLIAVAVVYGLEGFPCLTDELTDAGPGEFMANARLIAAAPDLLEALRNFAYCAARISPPPYGHRCMWCGDCVQKAKDDARAAIAKAEGPEAPKGDK